MALQVRLTHALGTKMYDLGSRTADKPVLIGRAPNCDIQVPSTLVGMVHCNLFVHEGQWVLQDAGSGGWTLVNGEPLAEIRPLAFGDVIVLGQGSKAPILEIDPLGVGARGEAARTNASRAMDPSRPSDPHGAAGRARGPAPIGGFPGAFAPPAAAQTGGWGGASFGGVAATMSQDALPTLPGSRRRGPAKTKLSPTQLWVGLSIGVTIVIAVIVVVATIGLPKDPPKAKQQQQQNNDPEFFGKPKPTSPSGSTGSGTSGGVKDQWKANDNRPADKPDDGPSGKAAPPDTPGGGPDKIAAAPAGTADSATAQQPTPPTPPTSPPDASTAPPTASDAPPALPTVSAACKQLDSWNKLESDFQSAAWGNCLVDLQAVRTDLKNTGDTKEADMAALKKIEPALLDQTWWEWTTDLCSRRTLLNKQIANLKTEISESGETSERSKKVLGPQMDDLQNKKKAVEEQLKTNGFTGNVSPDTMDATQLSKSRAQRPDAVYQTWCKKALTRAAAGRHPWKDE